MDPVTATLLVALIGSPAASVVANRVLDARKVRAAQAAEAAQQDTSTQDAVIGRLQRMLDQAEKATSERERRADEREQFWAERDRQRDKREDALLQHIYALNAWINDGTPPPPPPIPANVFE